MKYIRLYVTESVKAEIKGTKSMSYANIFKNFDFSSSKNKDAYICVTHAEMEYDEQSGFPALSLTKVNAIFSLMEK